MILAGDIGGTNARLALVELDGEALRIVREERYANEPHPGLESIILDFLGRGSDRPVGVAFGVAGPVLEDRVEMTNLGWVLERSALEKEVGCPVALLNDLQATGYGLGDLASDRTAVLQEGKPAGSTRALIAAGTGLGMAIIVRVAGRTVVLPSEGGHADLAARDEEEAALLRWLRNRYGRVSAERVVSGPGIQDTWEFLVSTGRHDPPADIVERIEGAEDRSVAISEMALEEGEPSCLAAVARFVAAYGAVAGNLALTALALGGVWLGGGIAPAILPLLREGPFLASFRDKGRLAAVVERIPVTVILDERAALLGAARYAILQHG